MSVYQGQVHGGDRASFQVMTCVPDEAPRPLLHGGHLVQLFQHRARAGI